MVRSSTYLWLVGWLSFVCGCQAWIASTKLPSCIPSTALFAQAPRNILLRRRRHFLAQSLVLGSGAWLGPCAAVGQEPDIAVYFGCGCFWHVQHEFVITKAEQERLGRPNEALTSRVGYAGGLGGTENGKVCYHNGKRIADYGKLGHAEVVSMQLPVSAFPEFATEYCKLFRKGYRPDQIGDRGSEYRNLVGIPGGIKNTALVDQLLAASKRQGDQLDFAAGKGSDDDVARLVWIMDSERFPFYKGEKYHQFHDGFMRGENYPDSYNRLIDVFPNEDFGGCPTSRL